MAFNRMQLINFYDDKEQQCHERNHDRDNYQTDVLFVVGRVSKAQAVKAPPSSFAFKDTQTKTVK